MPLSKKFNALLKSYPDSRKINSVSEGAEVLYVRLIARADDEGRFHGDPEWIGSKLFTSRMLSGQIDRDEIERRLVELERVGLVKRYQIGSETFLEMPGVIRSLRRDRPNSKHVDFPGNPDSATKREPSGNQAGTKREPSGNPLVPSTQPNPTQPNPTQPSWSVVVDVLRKLEVGESENLVKRLQEYQRAPEYALEIIQHYRDHPGAWGSPGLAWRLCHNLDLPATAGWPKKSEEAGLEKKRIDSEENTRRQLANRAQSAKDQQAARKTDQETHFRLERLAPREIDQLAGRALTNDILRALFRAEGIESQLVCDALISELDKGVTSDGQS